MRNHPVRKVSVRSGFGVWHAFWDCARLRVFAPGLRVIAPELRVKVSDHFAKKPLETL